MGQVQEVDPADAETVGDWTPEHLAHEFRRLSAARRVNLIVAVPG